MRSTALLEVPPHAKLAPRIGDLRVLLARRIKDDWILVALVVSTCLFAAGLATYMLYPAATTLVGSADAAWSSLGP